MMITNRMLYLFFFFVSFGLSAILTLDKIESHAVLWYDSYVKSLGPSDQLDLFNGLNDLGVFSSYAILNEKNISDMSQLIAVLNTATVDEEERILKCLSFLIKDAITKYSIKIEYEARVEAFYQKAEQRKELKEALNAFFNDLKSFMNEEGKEHSFLFVTELQKTRNGILDFARVLETLQKQIQDKDTIVKTEFEDGLVPHYYECRKVLEEGIHQFMMEAVGIQRLLNELILFYMNVIIKKMDL